ncbi:hypothetical protein EVAR_50273_1 [Eumeta japonica]|uniref:Uncharacterized protein n=1 Tax=Eumeta variegata TaxID=151549 RepID=A0A4C1YA78_EUMVA|nr:hypothetical protein EVAR_50273_1 [Eumeta japonica]
MDYVYQFRNAKKFSRETPGFCCRYETPSGYEVAYVKKPLREHEKPQDLSNVPGTPGVDYPIYHTVPDTSFSCEHVPIHPGMYANVETGCQVSKTFSN